MKGQATSKKTDRLEARVAPDIYALLQRAAALEGRTVSDFVVTAAQRAAQEAIAQRTVMDLSQADQERFAAALLAPPRVSAAIKRAAAAHRKLIKRT